MMAMNLFFKGKRTRHTPSRSEVSRSNGVVSQTKKIRPFSYQQSLAIVGDSEVSPDVTVLLQNSSPVNIPWFIVSVVLFPVKSKMRIWALSKFSEKFFKGIETELNASTAIVFISLVIRILTAGFSVFVDSVFRRLRHFMSAVVAASLGLQTIARLFMSVHQVLPAYFANGSAVTLTKPKGSSVTRPRISQNQKSGKSFAGKVLKSAVVSGNWYELNGKILSSHIYLCVGEFRSGSRELLAQFRGPFSILTQ